LIRVEWNPLAGAERSCDKMRNSFQRGTMAVITVVAVAAVIALSVA